MKVRRRSIPNDQIFLENRKKEIMVKTHRNSFHVHIWDKARNEMVVWREFTFAQFAGIFERLKTEDIL